MTWRAVYRLQLSLDFTFRDALGVVPYLRRLGVSHLYLSPSLQAASGSTHGYDVVDPTRISDELGGEEAFRELASAGLGVLLDVVPNHMATSDENRFWRDPGLRRRFFDWDEASGWYRRFFDIGELGGVRVEDPEVFATTHGKVLELVRDGETRTITVLGKGGHERTVPLNEDAVKALAEFKLVRGSRQPKEPFFKSRKGNALSRGAIYERVRTHARKA